MKFLERLVINIILWKTQYYVQFHGLRNLFENEIIYVVISIRDFTLTFICPSDVVVQVLCLFVKTTTTQIK